MREGWEIRPLGEVCEIYNGGTPSTNIPEYWDGGIQWITPKDMGRSKDMYVFHCERTISQEGVEHSSTKVLPERSVIVSSRAPIGYVAINEVPMATNQGCKGFVLGKEIYPEFLYYFLLSSTDLLNKLGTGATFKEVSGKKLAGIELPFPSIPEQQRIVNILDREFAKIDALKANAEKSLQAAKDLFQATLKKELKPKEGWNKTALGTLCEFSQGLQVDVKDQHSKCDVGMVRFLRIIDFTQGTEAPRYIIAPDKKYYLQKDGIAMVRYGTVGYVCYGYEGVIANNLFKIEVRNGFRMLNKYLFYVLKSDIFQSVIRQGVGGVAMPAISFGMIRNIIIPYPTEETFQKSIVSKLDNLNEKCNTLQENYQKTLALCDDLKQALLRKAFNGEL